MELELLRQKIQNGEFDKQFGALYFDLSAEKVRARYVGAIDKFKELYGACDVTVFSVPGRSEIIGNHTDHNHGKVLAAAINLDVIAVAAKTGAHTINIKSEGFDADTVEITDLAPRELEKFTSAAIIRGTCAKFSDDRLSIGGFNAYTTSDVEKGSGLSSSAAFEVLVGYILNVFFNDGAIPPLEIAKIAQFAENQYFGKPCGLMDQTACSMGGFSAIDFNNPAQPAVENLDFELDKTGYCLCIISTGGSHASLNDEYAAITEEMRSVASFFGKSVLREVDCNLFYDSIAELREKCGDRAVLRAMHYFSENIRVKAGAAALRGGDFGNFLSAVNASGNSSFKYLQNVYSNTVAAEQGLSLALALSERILTGKSSAIRVHGGGFAGTIQAFLPKKYAPDYSAAMTSVFGKSACKELTVRTPGATVVF